MGTDPTPSDGPRRPVLEEERHRRWTEGGGKGHRHQADRVHRLRILVFSLVGGFFGFLVGAFLAGGFPSAPLAFFYPVLGGILGFAGMVALLNLAIGGAGRAASIYMPGGSGHSAKRREYSLAESLVARGRYEDAVSAFELAVGEHPEDPVPYLRIARVHRDHLEDPERAARWFKRARRDAEMPPARERAVTRELIELYEKMGEPTRAAPELARLAEVHEGTPEAEWALGELEEVKKLIDR